MYQRASGGGGSTVDYTEDTVETSSDGGSTGTSTSGFTSDSSGSTTTSTYDSDPVVDPITTTTTTDTTNYTGGNSSGFTSDSSGSSTTSTNDTDPGVDSTVVDMDEMEQTSEILEDGTPDEVQQTTPIDDLPINIPRIPDGALADATAAVKVLAIVAAVSVLGAVLGGR